MYIIFYDISDPVRLKKVAKLLLRYGRRLQKSAFECDITDVRYRELVEKLCNLRQDTDKITSSRNGTLEDLSSPVIEKSRKKV